MSLRVLEPGLYSLLVDHGRPTTRSLGVPVGGAADRASLILGNALVGNSPAAAALEITLAGPTLQALASIPCVVHGAPFDVRVGDRIIRSGATFTLRANEVLRIGAAIPGPKGGARAYFCVHGGFLSPRVLGSRSGLNPVVRGNELICPPGIIGTRFLSEDAGRDRDMPRKLRVLDGAQADWFPAGEFHGHSFTVTPQSNRMGLRLDGQPLPFPNQELLSEPVCPGTVQVTRDGQCIVLGVDGQTIGGYPKIAQVISADLDVLGQLRPGDTLQFVRVGLEEAEALYRRRQAWLEQWVVRLGTAEILRP